MASKRQGEWNYSFIYFQNWRWMDESGELHFATWKQPSVPTVQMAVWISETVCALCSREIFLIPGSNIDSSVTRLVAWSLYRLLYRRSEHNWIKQTNANLIFSSCDLIPRLFVEENALNDETHFAAPKEETCLSSKTARNNVWHRMCHCNDYKFHNYSFIFYVKTFYARDNNRVTLNASIVVVWLCCNTILTWRRAARKRKHAK